MSDMTIGAPGAPPKRSRKDPIRPWFEASEELSDFVGIRFGRVPPGSGEPDWIYRSHSDYDGIGGLAEILRRRGVELESLPTIPHETEPSWLQFLRSLPLYAQRRDRVVWKAPFPLSRPAAVDVPPEAVAWRVFAEDDVSRIRERSRAEGVTVNSFLLKQLSAAVFPSLDERCRSMPWMVPVNLRGKVRRDRDTENHSSYVRVKIDREDSLREVHAKVYKALADGDHWANWLAYTACRPLPPPMRRAMITTERATAQWVIGAFSNLGVWDEERRFSGEGVDGDWLFMPPAMRFFKIGAGCVTFRGRLGLALHIHPELSADPADARRWMDAWGSHVMASLAEV